MKRVSIKFIPFILILLFLTLAACTANGPEASKAPAASAAPAGSAAAETLVLTLEELSAYNGENGSPAYIAVDGIIYDVTNVPQWKNGKHNGFTAGKDLTEEIKNISPHGVSKLKGIPAVGKLAE